MTARPRPVIQDMPRIDRRPAAPLEPVPDQERPYMAGYRCMCCWHAFAPGDARLEYHSVVDAVLCRECAAALPYEALTIPPHPARLVLALSSTGDNYVDGRRLIRIKGNMTSYPGAARLVFVIDGVRVEFPKDPVRITVESVARACWLVGVGNVCVE